MMERNEWPAARIVHILGGCRVVNNPGPDVELYPETLTGSRLRFQIPAYGAIYSKLAEINLSVVGTDFFSHIREVDGRIPPNWRPFHFRTTTVWPCAEVSQKWSNIGHAAYTRKLGRLWDLASRVSHQIRVCSWRLRQISEAYHEQLVARELHKDFRDGQRFEDGYTWLAYLSIQSFLVDACVLRDCLAEFTAEYYFSSSGKKPQVTSISGLLKHYLRGVDSSDPIGVLLREETADGGWLKELGCYRDLVVHSAPLAQAEQRLFAVTTSIQCANLGRVPTIRCPLPDQPDHIAARRSRGDLYQDFSRQFAAFTKAALGDIPSKDGLAYTHEVLGKLVDLALLLSDKAPVPPEMPIFDESNLRGPVRIEHE